MRAGIVTIEQLFCLINPYDQVTEKELDIFRKNRTHYSIPAYQREFKWEDSKIEDLIHDINIVQKFLGIVALEEKKNTYEIVDGQQRITTLFATLIAIFNILRIDDVITYEQKCLLKYLIRNDKFTLRNETIGDFCYHEGSSMRIDISEDIEIDIFKQKDDFDRLKETINNKLKEETNFYKDLILQFKRKLLKSTLLLLINEKDNESIEEVYIDINYKTQTLDVEDIYKGYCFKYVEREFHEELKGLWKDLKAIVFKFSKCFNYKNFDEYLYLYYLTIKEKRSINSKLKLRNRHILEKEDSDGILLSIKKMIKYGNNIYEFYKKIDSSKYSFKDICETDGDVYYKKLKYMCYFIMCYEAVYRKPVFFEFINFIAEGHIKDKIKFNNFSKFIMNYYLYSIGFLLINEQKNKSGIGYSNIDFFKNYKYQDLTKFMTDFNESLEAIKKKTIFEYKTILDRNYEDQLGFAFYSVIDNYKKSKMRLTSIYHPGDLTETVYTKEHLIISGHKKNIIIWKRNNGEKYTLKFRHHWRLSEKFINYIILEKTFNDSLENYDIIYKFDEINSHFPKLPNHIKIFFDYVSNLSSFQELKKAKENDNIEEEVIEKYEEFINEYFVVKEEKIRKTLYNEFLKVIT